MIPTLTSVCGIGYKNTQSYTRAAAISNRRKIALHSQSKSNSERPVFENNQFLHRPLVR
jgi:hypothetical protein